MFTDQADFPWWSIPFFVLGFLLFAYTATLFITMPVAVPILYSRAWGQGLRAFIIRYPWSRAVALSAGLDVYLTASEYRGEAPANVPLSRLNPDILYHGGQNTAELLIQYDQLHQADNYDGLLVITDGTGYGLDDEALAVPTPAAPVWMVHLVGYFLKARRSVILCYIYPA